MSYRSIPTKQKIERKLRDNPNIFPESYRVFILASLEMQGKLLNVISSFLSQCRSCRGGGVFCDRCETLIAMRDKALGKKPSQSNAPQKLQRAPVVVTIDDDENEPE